MFDIKLIREEPVIFDAALKRRKLEPQSSTLIEVDRKRREQEPHAQLLQTRRNELSNEIGKLKAARPSRTTGFSTGGKRLGFVAFVTGTSSGRLKQKRLPTRISWAAFIVLSSVK